MTFEEYQLTGRATYADFVEVVRTVLAAVVKARGFAPHAITGRAKDALSLRDKLAQRGIDPAAAIDEELKDLAGCRIVFLTNSQVDAFRNTGAIPENFDVISVNEHHPVPGTETEEQLFDSTNYLVTLKSDRLALPEYARFEGLKVEIQVQTLLNHAWAEMGHDTIYKEPRLRHIDRRHVDEINERMKRVMREHLLPAGHDFDKIARDFHRILRADEAVEATMATIDGSDNNDELLDAFETLETLVLPFVTDGRDRFLDLLPRIAAAVVRVRGTTSAPIDTIFGPYPGKGGDAVARRAAELIARGMHVDTGLTLDTLVGLYVGAESDAERKIWTDLGTRFAEHNVHAWRQVGPGVAQAILDRIAGLDADARGKARGLVLAMVSRILSCEIGGTSRGTLNTVLVHTGSIGSGDATAAMRHGAIDILERYLDETVDDGERAPVIAALWVATSPPMHGGSEALRILVLRDAVRVCAILQARVAAWGLELRRKVEVRAERVHRVFRTVPEAMAGNAGLTDARDAVVSATTALRDALMGDAEYVLYKTLVGRDSVAPSVWDEPRIGVRATQAWRAERFPELAAGVADDQGAEWAARVRAFLALADSGIDQWPLGEFLEILSVQAPVVTKHILERMDEELRPVLVRILLGLERAGEQETVQLQIARFLDDGRFLPDLADWMGRREEGDPDLLARLTERAIGLGDATAVLQAINAAGRIYQRAADPRLIDNTLLPAIDHLTSVGDPDWITRALDLLEGSMVAALDEAQSRSLLRSFVDVPAIDYDADRVLAVVGGRFPQLVLEFFGARLDQERKGMKGFEAIPFDVHDLKAVLARDARELVATTRRWYGNDRRFHQFRGGRLLSRVFPELGDEPVAALREIVAGGERDDLAFVLDTLSAYDGSELILPICMDVVDRLEPGDELVGRVSGVLAERGVMTGDFGPVEADRTMRSHLAAWLDDPREKVRTFAAEERRRIQQSMAWEQRRAEREVEQMKREWGGPDDAPSDTPVPEGGQAGPAAAEGADASNG